MKEGINGMTRLIIFFAVFVCACSPSKAENSTFSERTFEIADYGLFDLGVTDMNNDDRLDIFTANHSGRQGMLLNNGSGAFTDVYSTWEMDQDHNFPGLAIFPEEPPAASPGIYVNWVGPDVVVRAHKLDSGLPVQGRIEVLTSIEIISKRNFNVEITEKQISAGVPQSTIVFSGQGEGHFSFRPYNHALPFQFHFDDKVGAENIHVGSKQKSPDSRNFLFQLRDRHGMVWADINNDDRMDVFITRGGERDTMGKLPLSFWDELFIGTPSGMEDIGRSVGLEKKGCPGRQAAWIDYNQDKLLDIYVVCGRGDGPHQNMLFQQTSDGRFEDVAEKVGLDIRTNGPFVWMDADNDGDMDLFWADTQGYFLFRNEKGVFRAIQLDLPARRVRSGKLTVSDFDRDGDFDVFFASPSGNVSFVNTNGNFSAFSPASAGLPEKSYTANWVDYDNDGRPDLHAVPDGLYRQIEGGRFVSTGLLKISRNALSPYRSNDARCSWFDVDNNGTRDLLQSTEWGWKNWKVLNLFLKTTGLNKRFGGLNSYWETVLYDNKNTENHWLQVQLSGPPGNRQAIGARVTLQTADGKQMQQVGNADGSHYSQGHYRLYYGLGPHSELSSLHVDWPDGKTTEIIHPSADRLLKIVWPQS